MNRYDDPDGWDAAPRPSRATNAIGTIAVVFWLVLLGSLAVRAWDFDMRWLDGLRALSQQGPR